jgi:peptide/nickel transport system substrate-binding protein
MMTNVLQNTTLTPVYPIYWTINGKPPTVKKIDDVTFSFSYDDPAALLPEFLCYIGRTLIAPMHYLKQFHPDFTPAAQLSAAVKKAKFQNVQQYYAAQSNFWTNKDLPVMNPWVMTQPMPSSGGHAVSTRNPYYYKVDPAGQQLPYVDKITYDVLDAAAAALHASNGQIDLQSNNISFTNVPVLAQNAASKGYVVNHWQSDAPWIAMYINQYSPDAVLRPILQNAKFRQALSLAINRDEMNQSLYAGQGGDQQPCGVPEDPYFVKGSGNTWTKYDPDTANSLLDGLGLKMGPNGVRTRPDGKPLELIIETFEFETGVDSSDGYEFVTRYWGKVGVKTTMKTEDSSLWVQRVEANNVSVAGYTVAGFLWDVDPEWYVPVATNSYWAPMFGLYYSTNGKQGVKPIPIVAKLQDLYNQLRAEIDKDKRLALGQQILSIHNDNVFIIGTVTQPWEPMISNADMINVRSTSIESYRMGHEQATKIEQVAYKNPGQHNYA